MITPISINTTNIYNKNQTNSAKHKANIAFGQHYEFNNLYSIYERPLSSVFFRRGTSYAFQSMKFEDVITALKQVFKLPTTPKMLVVGVGKAQEPLSYLAVAKDIYKNKSMESVVDLHCVDLQDKITDKNLDNYAFIEEGDIPRFAKESFIDVSTDPKKFNYRVKSEILDYLKKVFNNPEKAKWETKIQDFAAACNSKTYDLISINNVLLYIRNRKEKIQLMENLIRILNEKGFLVTDPENYRYLDKILQAENCEEVKSGIWQKK